MRRKAPFALLCLALLAPAAASARPAHGTPTGDVLVRLSNESPETLAPYGALTRLDGAWPVYLVSTADAEPAALSRVLGALPGVRWAEPDRFVTPVAQGPVVDDPLFPDQWHLQNTNQYGDGMPGADVNVLPAWAITVGAGVRVAIFDSGVDLTHPDLRVVDGLDVVDGDEDATPPLGEHSEPHGTAVAGLAAAIGDNALGVTGVAHGADVLAVRLIGTPEFGDGPTLAALYNAFVWATDNGAVVINNSWSFVADDCGDVFAYQPLADAVAYARLEGREGLGTTVVWSAGNQGCDHLVFPVHAEPGVVVVGASNDRDLHIHYSNTGTQLDIMAPSGGRGGEHLWTTDIQGLDGYNTAEDGDYWNQMSGTSASAPLLSGVVALMVAANPRLDSDTLFEAMCATAVRVHDWDADYDATGWSPIYGCGRVDAGAAVAAVANGEPGAPTPGAPVGEVRADRAVLTWSPASDPDGDLLDYEVELAAQDEAALRVEAGAATSWNLRDTLAPGTYAWRVRALDRWGPGPWSADAILVVTALPDPPAPASLAGDGCASVAGGSSLLSLLLLPLLARRRCA